MSYATVKALWLGEKVEDLQKFSGQHWGACCIWEEMGQRYLGTPPNMVRLHLKELWPFWRELNIPKHQRAVLAMTYDRTYIAHSDYARAAADIRLFIQDFPEIGSNEFSHWPNLLALLESNPTCPAIGFQWVSVAQDLFTGNWNDDINDYDPLDWNAFWNMYAELDKLEMS